jgi:4-azaleucine resistance transporter AzlC
VTGPVIFTRAGVVRGMRECIPMLIGVTPFGIVAGIMAQTAGLSRLESVLMSGLIYGGSAQLLALSAWTHPAPILAATLAAFVVNLRMALMGPLLAPWLDRLRGWQLWGSLFVMADQNWAHALRDINRGGRDAGLLFGSGLIMWSYWVLTTTIGHMLGDTLRPPPGHPLFFAALAVFVAMLVGMWRGRGDIVPWVIAAGTAVVVARLLPGTSWYIIAGALTGSITGGVRDHLRAGMGRV